MKLHLSTIGLVYAMMPIKKSESFLFSRNNDVHPNLFELANTQTGKELNVELQIKNPKSLSQLFINGLTFELQCQQPSNEASLISLPGCNGDNPALSTGPLLLKTKASGKFVSLQGSQSLPIEQEAWEMIWADERPAGSIVCGFHLPYPVNRNDAVLPKGPIFLNFRVWTKKGLHEIQNEAYAYERRLAEHQQYQKEALEKMNSTGNPIMKAIHFRNAAAANEMLSLMYTNRFQTVPMTDEEVISIGDKLLVAKQGSIWTTINLPAFIGKKSTHVYIGGAVLK